MEDIEFARTFRLSDVQDGKPTIDYEFAYFESEVKNFKKEEMRRFGGDSKWFSASVGSRYSSEHHILSKFAEGTEFNYDSIKADEIGDTRDKYAPRQIHEFREDPSFSELEDTLKILGSFYSGVLTREAGKGQGFREKKGKKEDCFIPLNGGYNQNQDGSLFVMNGILRVPRSIYVLDLFTSHRWNILLRVASDGEIKNILRFLSMRDKKERDPKDVTLTTDLSMIEKARALGKIR